MRWRWSGDRDAFLAQLPAPYFREADAFTVADRMQIARHLVQGIWYRLRIEGRIIRSEQAIGKSRTRRYWQRSHCRLHSPLASSSMLLSLTQPPSCGRRDRRIPA